VIKNKNLTDILDIAVLIPCFNEATTINKVVSEFLEEIPSALIYVYDNSSTDDTAKIAAKAGAIVRSESNIGKGNVVRRMFADIEADIYIIVDGDDTYEVSKSPHMVNRLIEENLDMVVATRKTQNSHGEYRWGHVFGNWMLTCSVSLIFGNGFTDMLSGYRVFSNRFVKSIPVLSKGFEIETELTVHALQVGSSFAEVETNYISRPEGSESKLSTFKDGFRILGMILILFKENKPFQFFGLCSLMFFVISILISIPLLLTYIEIGLVPRIPTAILSTGLMILSFFSLISGVILDSLSRSRVESKKANYLQFKSLKGK
jgi:glycosyltransferase involved in cell wall biosynthesis